MPGVGGEVVVGEFVEERVQGEHGGGSLVLWVGWWVGLVVQGCDDEEDAGVFFVEAAVV